MDIDSIERLRRVILWLARHLNKSATAEGLTPTQASVLGVIAARGPLSLAEIVGIENLNPTMLSRVLSTLEEAGFITRVPDPTDLRAVHARATPEGKVVHGRLRTQRAAAVAELVDGLDAEAQSNLVAALPALEALAAEMQRLGGSGALPGRQLGNRMAAERRSNPDDHTNG